MSRVLDVLRMHLLVRLTFVTLPLIILGGAFALTLAVFALIPSDGVKIAGAGQAPCGTSCRSESWRRRGPSRSRRR